MKKFLFVSVMFLVTSVTIISCKKDSTSGSIVGTWVATSAHTVEVDFTSPPTTSIQDTTFTPGKAGTITFNTNGTYSIADPNDDPPSSEAGTYTIANGTITTIPTSSTGDGSLTVEGAAYSISGNKLTVIDKVNFPAFSGFPGFSTVTTLILTRQ